MPTDQERLAIFTAAVAKANPQGFVAIKVSDLKRLLELAGGESLPQDNSESVDDTESR